jgi:NADPH:quinone reductase-like Zn-dependent oxidoreductase
VDTQVRAGAWVPDAMGDPPMILGWDIAGTVEEAGDGVSDFASGDWVFGMLRFPALGRCDADYVVAPARGIARAPASLTNEQAGALPLAGLTAWQALVDRAAVGEGDRVLVQAGPPPGSGTFAVQIAKARGAVDEPIYLHGGRARGGRLGTLTLSSSWSARTMTDCSPRSRLCGAVACWS